MVNFLGSAEDFIGIVKAYGKQNLMIRDHSFSLQRSKLLLNATVLDTPVFFKLILQPFRSPSVIVYSISFVHSENSIPRRRV